MSVDGVISIVTEELRAIVMALLNGAKYGLKIRIPHATMTTLLFRRDLSAREKLHSIVQVAMEHAGNLAAFATIYKTLLTSFKWLSRHLRHSTNERTSLFRKLGQTIISILVDGPIQKELHTIPWAPAGHPEHAYHAFVAGAVGGYVVWGRHSSVNYQIVLYLASRVLVGAWKRFFHTSETDEAHPRTYPLAAAMVWGVVMALFEESPHVLHRSLRSSMDEIYKTGLRSTDTTSGLTV